MSGSARGSDKYLQKLSLATKNSWIRGVYGFHSKPLESRICKNKICGKTFKVKPYLENKFCSKSCAAIFNNSGRKLKRETKLKIASTISGKPVTLLQSEIIRIPRIKPAFNIEKVELERLYLIDKLNASDIGKKHKVTVWQVLKKMRKYNIPRRTSAESNNINFLKKPPSFNFKENLTENEKLLYYSALMLYWAEGYKRTDTMVDFANSDYKMAVLFLKALRNVFRIDENRLRVQLFCYPNQNPTELIQFWSVVLNVPSKQFIKTYVRKIFNKDKIDRLKYGVIHIRYADKKLHGYIMHNIDIIQGTL